MLMPAVCIRAQNGSAPASDALGAVTIAHGCVTSHSFNFSYRLPEGMKAQEIPGAPAASGAPAPTMLFVAYRDRGVHRDVAVATAEDESGEKDKSAAKWMDKLREANGKREGVVDESDVQSLAVNGQKFASLTFRQVREDGSVVNEAVYATALRGYIVSFTLGSADASELDSMEQSIQSFSPSAGGCPASP